MNTKNRLITAAIAAIVLIGGVGYYKSALAAGTSSVPGSTNDPIVTKSYVDEKIAEAVGAGGSSSTSAQLEVVTVALGKKLIVEAGGEVIVRAGKAIAYSSDVNGLSDLTDGLDIPPGKAVSNNHLILFPRDGRGIEADPGQKSGLTVLVRGGYKIE
ncbi:hypothetical protein [Cohnella fermenti]|uniref:Uncharacterized protein n=1 Tax=Cohnella fermenti TaxID=2565925 RepID=A0A4S4BZY7_9BACL|nr:hypothetical protein [Cohnella fermenti]THF80855.1 hypothetical protein E6C55_10270 [Cohnella fermenti]